jgi:AcrR family transcriptional regulator
MPVSDPPGLRERILVAARQRFVQQGYRGLSMREIADAVGVSKPALYYHFQDKERLFLAVIDADLNEMEVLLDRIRAEGEPALRQIASLVREILTQPAEKRAAIHLARREMSQLSEPAQAAVYEAYREKFFQKIQDILETGIRKGELRQVNTGVAAWALLGIMYPFTSPAHTLDAPIPTNIIDQILEIYLSGVAIKLNR